MRGYGMLQIKNLHARIGGNEILHGIDLSVGPDGRVYALDDYRDLIVVFEGLRQVGFPQAEGSS